jgi:hypothetical protein
MRRASIILGILLLGLGVAILPLYLRAKVRSKLPQGVTASEISLGVSGVTLKGITVDKGWIKGAVAEMWISRDEHTIRVTGGDLVVDLDKRPKEGAEDAKKRDVKASGLNVYVNRGRGYATLKNVTWDGVPYVSFDSADFGYAYGTTLVKGTVTKGYAGKEGSYIVRADKVTAHLDGDLPGPAKKLDIRDVEVEGLDTIYGEDQWTFNASKVTAGPFVATTIRATDDDVGLNATVEGVRLDFPWLDVKPATFPKATLWANLWPKRPFEKPSGFVTLSKGTTSATINFNLDDQRLEGAASCAEWASVLPDTTPDVLKNLRFTGDLAFSVSVKPTPHFGLDARCKAVCASLPNLRRQFTYTAYRADGTPFQRLSGPNLTGWLYYDFAGRMPMAVINMEDSAFPYHKGYLTEAFQNSLVDNLAKGKFARGGSTITQQTAKNLWLGRQKTILRKVDELFLAQALESCLTKDQILETYLNIVEFGPDIYGVQEGARHWFGKSPDALEPNEAFWLASILPAPKRATAPTDEDQKRVGRIMASLAAQGKIPDFGTDIDVSDVPEWEAPH